MNHGAVVIGTSAGGVSALTRLLGGLPADFPLPLLVVQHLHKRSSGDLPGLLDQASTLPVTEAEDKQQVVSGRVYLAPPDYHLLVEDDTSLALSADEKVHYARPAIDVLFCSAAEVYRQTLCGVVLTGANRDGSAGLLRVKQLGGFTLVQDPADAVAATMPATARDVAAPHVVAPLGEIAGHLVRHIGPGATDSTVQSESR